MNKRDVKSIEDLDKYLIKCRKFKFNDNIKIVKLDDIYKYLFNIYGDRNSQYSDGKSTFYKNGTIHCKIGESFFSNKYRSINDFLILSKYYFPNLTIKEILKFLVDKEKILNERGYKLLLEYCGNIKKCNIRSCNAYGSEKAIYHYRLNDLFPNLDIQVHQVTE